MNRCKAVACFTFLFVFPGVFLAGVLAAGSPRAETLGLEEAVAEALEKSLSLKQIEKEREAGGHALAESRARFYPSVNLSGGYAWQRGAVAPGLPGLGTREGDSLSVSLGLGQPIYTGGALEAGEKSARLGLEMTETGYRQAEQEIILAVTLSYIEVLRGYRTVHVFQRLVENRERHLRDVIARVEQGVLPRLEELRAEVELADSRDRLLGAENRLRAARGALNRLLERELDDSWEPVDFPPTTEPELPEKPSEYRAAVGDRPEIALARLGVEMAGAGVRSARADLLPSVSLRLSREYRQGDAFRSSWQENDQVGIFLEYDIWNRGRTTQALERRRREEEKASLAVAEKEKGLALELRNAWLSLASAHSRMSAVEKAVAQAEEVLRMQRVRFAEGLATPTEVMDADLALAQASINHDSAWYDYLAARAEWRKALGGPVIPLAVAREGNEDASRP